MLFEIQSTKSRIMDQLPLLPAPEPGMFAKVLSGNSVMGQLVRVSDGRWALDNGDGDDCPDHWLY